jgi:pimeloyl-ACP methyl ester carboxylesterase
MSTPPRITIAKDRPQLVGTVTTDDGINLAVTQAGPAAPITAVFCHGLGLHADVWVPQRSELTTRWRGRARMVFYDGRGHGASDPAPAGTATVDRLARDLADVIDAVAPDGPLVLIGHSMGGMTVLALAAAQRWLPTERIAGVALLSTTAGRVAGAGITRVLDTPAHRLLEVAADRTPTLLARCWTAARCTAPLLGPVFCGESVRGAKFLAESRSDITTLVELVTDMKNYDAVAALPILRDIPASVVCGRHDLFLPVGHSRRLAAGLADSELLILPGAHMIGVERPIAVNAALDRLLRRSEHRIRGTETVPTRWQLPIAS